MHCWFNNFTYKKKNTNLNQIWTDQTIETFFNYIFNTVVWFVKI